MGSEEEAEKTVIVVGVDESEHSMYGLEWTVGHFFSIPIEIPWYKLVVVNARPPTASLLHLHATAHEDLVKKALYRDLRSSSLRVIAKAKEICHSVSALFIIYEGDARDVLCEAVEKHHADMLVLGSHGYGAIRRAELGSVSDYCAHHAQCTVMIVKKPN